MTGGGSRYAANELAPTAVTNPKIHIKMRLVGRRKDFRESAANSDWTMARIGP